MPKAPALFAVAGEADIVGLAHNARSYSPMSNEEETRQSSTAAGGPVYGLP